MDRPVTPEMVEQALLKAENADPDALRSVLANAPVWHTPGRNLLSGDHLGREQVVTLLREYHALTHGTFHVEEKGRVQARGDEARVRLHANATRDGRAPLDLDAEVRFRLEEGRVAELWTTPADPAAWDKFWSP